MAMPSTVSLLHPGERLQCVRHLPSPGGTGEQPVGSSVRSFQGRRDPRTVTITLLDETRTPVCVFVLHRAQQKKWIGPELSAKGGGEVAMEELHLVAERIDFQSV